MLLRHARAWPANEIRHGWRLVEFVDALPKSGAGKILKTELRKMYGGYKASDK